MSRREEERLERLLEGAVENLLADRPTKETVTAAASRVRSALRRQQILSEPSAGESTPRVIRGCGDFQAMIPDYLNHRLPRARALLLEDHTRGCVSCRRALIAAREGHRGVAEPDGERFASVGRSAWMMRAAAVLAVIGAALSTWWLMEGATPSSSARVAALDGQLLQLERDAYLDLQANEEVPFGEVVRSTRDSGAVLELPDGSRVEMAARSEIQLGRRNGGTVIRLRQGNVIVDAAPQGSGRLYVDSEDCLVTVRGTVFSVNRGTKGSRVSVVEGQVQVDTQAQSHTLAPGDQISTHPSIIAVPVADEIAWSRDVDAYRDLLEQLDQLRQEVDDALSGQDLRTSTELLRWVPGQTVIYGALPNVAANLQEAYYRVQDRVNESPVLQDFWEDSFGGPDEAFEEGLSHFAALGEQLGTEVVFAVVAGEVGAGDGEEELVLIAENTAGRAALTEFIQAEIDSVEGGSETVRLVEDPFTGASSAAGSEEDLLIWVGEEAVVAATSFDHLASVADSVEAGTDSPFVDSPFYGRLSEAYAEGVDYLVAADLGWIMAHSNADEGSPQELSALEASGILDVRYLLLERQPSLMNDRVEHRVELSFDGSRQGLAGWLAAPAPMGSLELISPDARFVTAALVKEPVDLAEDLLDLLETMTPDIRSTLQEAESQQGFSMIDDIAVPLGGEVAFALDGPLLPEPSWKLVVEVYDPERLQLSLQALVDRFNTKIAATDSPVYLSLRRQGSLDGNPQWRLESSFAQVGISYLYSGGYLVAAPNRSVLRSALQFRDSGYHFARADSFTQLLPQGRQANFSGIFYQDLGDVLGPVAEVFGGLAGDELGEPQRMALQEIASRQGPTLASAYGEEDRIVFVSNSQSDALMGLLGASSFVSGDLLGQLIDQAVEPTAGDSGSSQ
ncbi:MAG: FecR domain-containing protein [Acidobacteriota bacterium]